MTLGIEEFWGALKEESWGVGSGGVKAGRREGGWAKGWGKEEEASAIELARGTQGIVRDRQTCSQGSGAWTGAFRPRDRKTPELRPGEGPWCCLPNMSAEVRLRQLQQLVLDPGFLGLEPLLDLLLGVHQELGASHLAQDKYVADFLQWGEYGQEAWGGGKAEVALQGRDWLWRSRRAWRGLWGPQQS